jgi:hypothetical protein
MHPGRMKRLTVSSALTCFGQAASMDYPRAEAVPAVDPSPLGSTAASLICLVLGRCIDCALHTGGSARRVAVLGRVPCL